MTDPKDMSMEELAAAHREVGDKWYPLDDEIRTRLDLPINDGNDHN